MNNLYADGSNYLIYSSSESEFQNRLAEQYLGNVLNEHSENPQDELAKMQTSKALTLINPALNYEEVYNNYNAYMKQYTGVDVSPQSAKQAIGNHINKSIDQSQVSLMYYQQIFNENPERWEEISAKEKELLSLDWQEYGPLAEMLISAADIFPQIMRSFGTTAAGAAVGAGVGYLTGGVPGAAKGTKLGAKLGMWAGATIMGAEEAGGAYAEILKFEDADGNKVSPQVAKSMALGVGAVNMLIEKWQLDSFPGVKDLFNRFAGEASRKALAGGFLKEVVAKWGKGVLEESTQEAFQETITIIGGEIAKLAANADGANFDKADFDANLKRVAETFWQSAKGFAVLGVGGAVSGTAMQYAPSTTNQFKEANENFDIDSDTHIVKKENIVNAPSQEESVEVKEGETVSREPLKGVILPGGKFKLLDSQKARMVDAKNIAVKQATIKDIEGDITAEERIEINVDSKEEFVKVTEDIAVKDSGTITQAVDKDGRNVASITYSSPAVIQSAVEDIVANNDVWGVYPVAGKDLTNTPVVNIIMKVGGALSHVRLTSQDYVDMVEKTGARKLRSTVQEMGGVLDTIAAEDEVENTVKELGELEGTITGNQAGEVAADVYNAQIEEVLGRIESFNIPELNTIVQNYRNVDVPTTGEASVDERVDRVVQPWEVPASERIGEYVEKVKGDFAKQITEALPALTDTEVAAVVILVEQIATYKGMDLEDFLKSTFEGFGTLEEGLAKAGVLTKGDKHRILLTNASDVSSMIHEFAHIMKDNLTPEHLATVETAYGIENGEWSTPAEEKFVSDFEEYINSGKVANEELNGIFQRLKEVFLSIYRQLKGIGAVDPNVVRVFDEIMTAQGEDVGSVGVPDSGIRFQTAPAPDTAEFKNFFKDSKVKDRDGDPILMHHATTHRFTTFTKDRANPENDMGKGFYFTNTEDDAVTNYQSGGPDLTSRITRMAESIFDVMQENPEDFGFAEDYEPTEADAQAYAEVQLKGGEDIILDVYIDMKNPVIIGTPFEISEERETFLEYSEAYDEENDEFGEPEGELIDFVEALRNNTEEYEVQDIDTIISSILEAAMDYEGLSAKELIKILKESNEIAYAQDYEGEGDLIGNEIIRQTFEDIGYDGILDFTVNEKFGTRRQFGQAMSGVNKATFHAIAFTSNQVKSVENQGSFDPSNPDIRFQLAPPTDSEAFKNWFGNSKVVDENGEPEIMYHGSDRELTIIEPGYDEPGAWFTNRKTASNYAKGMSGSLHAVYLSISNPLVVMFNEDMIPTINGEATEFESNVEIVKYAQKNKYDGVNFPIGNFSEDDNTWVAFSPTQIKSVYNQGSFDPGNADIRFQTDYDTLETNQKEAIDEYLSNYENAEINLAKYKDTSFGRMLTQTSLLAAAIEKAANTDESTDVILKLFEGQSPTVRNAAAKIISNIKRHGLEEGLWKYAITGKNVIGKAEKPGGAVSSRYVNCKPSESCAKYCYACKGNFNMPNVIIKQEIVGMLADINPIRLSEAIVREYRAKHADWKTRPLRLFDRGDISESWLTIVEELNNAGISTHIFSKNPDILSQVDNDKNVVLLSIDNTNMDVAREYPNLPVALVYTGERDDALIRELGKQIQVILPVRIKNKLLSEELQANLRIVAKEDGLVPNICPIDGGKKKLYEGACFDCAKAKKGIGCYYNNKPNTTAVVANQMDTLYNMFKELDDDEQRKLYERFARELKPVAGERTGTGSEHVNLADTGLYRDSQLRTDGIEDSGDPHASPDHFEDDIRFQPYYITDKKKKEILKESANSIKDAVEAMFPVPDHILEDYKDFPWAAEEISRRSVIRGEMSWILDIEAESPNDLKLKAEGAYFTLSSEEQKAIDDNEIAGGDEFYEYVYNINNFLNPDVAEAEFVKEYGTPEGVGGIMGMMKEFPKQFKATGIPRRFWQIATKRNPTEADFEMAAKMVRKNPETYRWALAQGNDDTDALRQLYNENAVRDLADRIIPADVNALPVADRAALLAETDDPVLRTLITEGLGSEDFIASLEAAHRKILANERRKATMTKNELKESVKGSDRVANNLRNHVASLDAEIKAKDKEIRTSSKRITTLNDRITKLKEKYKSSKDEFVSKQLEALRKERRLLTLISKQRDAMLKAQKRVLQEKLFEAKLRMEETLSNVKEKQRLKDMARRLRAEKQKLVSQIMRPAAKSVDYKYKRLVEALQALVDPHFRGVKNTKRWEESIALIQDEEILNLFSYEFDLALNKPMNLWDVNDLVLLKGKIDQLKMIGRAVSLTKDIERKARLTAKTRDFIENNITGDEPVYGEGSIEQMKHDKASLLDFAKVQTARPSRMLRILDGYREGGLYGMFWVELNKNYDKYIVERTKRVTAGMEAMKELGIKESELTEKFTVVDKGISYTYTVDDIIYLYVSQFNEYQRAAVIGGNNIAESALLSLISKLDPKFTAWGDWMLKEFDNNYERLRQAHIEYANEDLGHQQNYFTIIRDKFETLKMSDILGYRTGLQKAYANKDMTNIRKEIALANQTPVRLGATQIWRRQIEKQEHYINNGGFIKDAEWLLDQGGIKNMVRTKYGKQYANWLQVFINDYANPQFYRDDMSYAASRVRKNMAIGYLGLNYLTVLKQVASFTHFLRVMGPHRLIAAVAKFGANPKKWYKLIDELSPQMHQRRAYQVMEDIQHSKAKTKAGKAIDKFGALTMKPIGLMDNLTVSILWLGAFDKFSVDRTQEEAAQKATEFILETQPASSTKDLPQIYRKDNSNVLKFMLMFTNQLNQNWNSVVFDTTYQLKNKQYGQMALTIVSVAMSTVAISLISGWTPEEDEPWKDSMEEFMTSALNIIPLFGGDIAKGFEGWTFSSGSPLDVAKDLGSLGKSIKDKASIDKVMDKLIDAGESSAIYAAGVPVTGLKRMWNAATEADIKELLGSGWLD